VPQRVSTCCPSTPDTAIWCFLSPLYNLRTDEFADPVLFLNLVLEAIRERLPEIALGIRFSAVEGVEGGLDADATYALIEQVRTELLDFLDVSAGNYEAGEWIIQSGEWTQGFQRRRGALPGVRPADGRGRPDQLTRDRRRPGGQRHHRLRQPRPRTARRPGLRRGRLRCPVVPAVHRVQRLHRQPRRRPGRLLGQPDGLPGGDPAADSGRPRTPGGRGRGSRAAGLTAARVLARAGHA
jgi:hypothetical protein